MAVALCARVADSLAKRFTTLLSASTSCICMRSEDMSTAIPVGEDHGSANEPPDPSCLPLVPLMGSPSKAEHEPEASHPGPTPASAAFCRMLLGSFQRVARRAREISYCIVGWPLRIFQAYETSHLALSLANHLIIFLTSDQGGKDKQKDHILPVAFRTILPNLSATRAVAVRNQSPSSSTRGLSCLTHDKGPWTPCIQPNDSGVHTEGTREVKHHVFRHASERRDQLPA
jgi:hypothetical protein